MSQTTIAEGPPQRTSRAETKAATRDRLLSAARQIFLTTGYQGTTLDAIAAEAGFTKGAVYWHFPNKQSLFFALVGDSIQSNLVVLEAMLAENRSDPQRLKAIISQWIDGIDRRETLPTFGVELEIEARRDQSFRAIHQKLVHQHEATLAQFLTQYFEAVGEAPKIPVMEMSIALIALFKGFALSRQNRPDIPASSAKLVRCLLGLPIDG